MPAAKINQVSVAAFGCDAVSLDPTAALWLAERIMRETGKNAYRRISNLRNKAGKGTDFPAYGTALFAGI
jgi:hypothetical protein